MTCNLFKNPQTLKITARILMVIYLGIVALICFSAISTPKVNHLSLWGIPGDKIVHFLMFLPFPVLAWGSFPPKDGIPAWKVFLYVLAIFITGTLIGATTELVQDFLPNRCRELADVIADSCGIGTSCLALLIWRWLK
ncbi:MAG: VanZ family protein [Bacteroidales bacterium]|nr:VanZ family protein [Bacteroidales bacterium]